MYIAMNRFRVAEDKTAEFEKAWKERERHLSEMDGFLLFQVLKGKPIDGAVTYISKTDWETEHFFTQWTESEQFKAAHKGAKMEKGIILGPPNFEGYEVIMEE